MEPNYHDHFFRETMAQPEVAADFLTHYLPIELAALFDTTSVELMPGTFVDEQLREHRSDLIYRVRMRGGGAAYVYFILEHKSYVYPLVSWQVLKYAVQEWEMEIRSGAVQLTPIVPIVFYHGAAAWAVAREFSALFAWEGRELLRPYAPEFRYYLCDLSAIADDELQGGWRLRAILTTLKHIFDRHAGNLWPRLIAIFKNAPERVGVPTLGTLLRYIVGVREVTEAELGQLIDATYPQAKEETMTTLTRSWKQQGIQEGRQQGLQQGLQEGLQQGLQQGRVETLQTLLLRQLQHRFGALDEAVQTRLLKLPVEALEALGEAWLDFLAIDDLTKWLDQNETARQ